MPGATDLNVASSRRTPRLASGEQTGEIANSFVNFRGAKHLAEIGVSLVQSTQKKCVDILYLYSTITLGSARTR